MDFISCVLRNFRCSDYTEPIPINNTNRTIFYLLYQDKELLNIGNSYMYVEFFGLESLLYLKDHFICYKRIEDLDNDSRTRRIVLNNIFVECQLFSNALWFIKDNAVLPYLASICSDQNIEPEVLRKNLYYSNSLGNADIVEFSKDELKEAMSWYDILESFTHKKEKVSIDMSKQLTNTSHFISFNTPSFQRAYYYLSNARISDFLPAKIASYISVLETLFAVYGENTHKVSERAALLIGKDSEERVSIYYNVKYCYDIRSWYVHGKQIKDDKRDMFPKYCSIIDDIIRRVFKKMLVEHNELNYTNQKQFENVDRWFNEYVIRRK